MAFPENQVLVRLQFQVGGSAELEIQNTGFWATVQGASGVDFDWQNAVNGIAEKVRDTWRSEMDRSHFSAAIVGQSVIAYHYRQDHKEVLHRGEAPFDADHVWGGTGNALPLQCSVVLSLYGYDPGLYAPQRDRKRGRMYLPTPSSAELTGEGTLTVARQTAILAACADWWAALQGAIDPGIGSFQIQPQICSVAGQLSTDARWLRVGRVIDTQRRRRNALKEEYLTTQVN